MASYFGANYGPPRSVRAESDPPCGIRLCWTAAMAALKTTYISAMALMFSGCSELMTSRAADFRDAALVLLIAAMVTLPVLAVFAVRRQKRRQPPLYTPPRKAHQSAGWEPSPPFPSHPSTGASGAHTHQPSASPHWYTDGGLSVQDSLGGAAQGGGSSSEVGTEAR